MGHVIVIAELGSNPAPGWEFVPWCDAASRAGADAVKVQLFQAGHFPPAEQAAKRELEFPRARLISFVRIAHVFKLQAGASVFDTDAVALAAKHCDFLKLAARESMNAELFDCAMLAAFRRHKTLYRSMPVMDWAHVQWSEFIVNFGVVPKYPASILASLMMIWATRQYMRKLTDQGEPWGWSSHTTGYLDCVLAARLGASVIEKHLAMTPGDIEAGHSLQPAKFAAMCRAIRKVE